MSLFNVGIKPEKVYNAAGGRAYAMRPMSELLHAVLTTFLETKAYETGDARLQRIRELIPQVPAQFVANLAIVARKEFHLRSVSHVLIAELSKIHRGDGLVMRTLEAATERPDDLTEIAAYLGCKLSKQTKRGMRRALLKFSPYSLAKYRMDGKKVKLVDIFNLVHPKAQHASEAQQEAWKALMEGRLVNTDTWESRLSSGEDKKAVWRDMVLEKKIGYMALLRNLRNIEADGDPETKQAAAAMIADPELVQKSKQLPFRYWKAYKSVKERKFLDAVAKAMEHAVGNVPDLDGTTLIAIDGSGSMDGDPIEKASILAAALVKKADCDVVIYDLNLVEARFNSIDSVMSNAQGIQHQANGGGTDTSLVFKYAAATKKPYKRIIILSDNESWGGSVQHIYQQYKTLNDCYVYAIDIEGYGTTDVMGDKVEHICGFSERIFEYILAQEKGADTLLEHVCDYHNKK